MDIDKVIEEADQAYHKINETKEITGTIQEKEEKQGPGPVGFFYLDNNKYTCWNDIFFNGFNKGDMVTIYYQDKENEWNGKIFINKNIINIMKG
jgi:hypothetical protein